MLSSGTRTTLSAAFCLAYGAPLVAGMATQKEMELSLQTPTDYLWAALKLGLAFSPIIAIGAIVGCSKEEDEVEAVKQASGEGHSCKT